MKSILGVALIVLGIILGLWLGVWVMFVGGIIQVVDACKNDWQAFGIAVGIIKIIGAGAIGWICGLLPASVGYAFIMTDK